MSRQGESTFRTCFGIPRRVVPDNRIGLPFFLPASPALLRLGYRLLKPVATVEDPSGATRTQEFIVEMPGRAVETLSGALETQNRAVETLSRALETLSREVQTVSGALETLGGALETQFRGIEMPLFCPGE